MKHKMGSKVYILSSQKTDGRYNKGKIVGVELSYSGLGYWSEVQYLSGFDNPKYKVAYVDVFTGRGCYEWYSEDELQKEKP